MAGKGIIAVLKGKGVVAFPIGYIVPILACFGLNGLSRKNSDPLHWIKSNCIGMLAAWGRAGGHYITLSSSWACWTWFKNNYLITPLFDQASKALIWHDFIHFPASTHCHPFPSSFHIASSSYRMFLKASLTRFLCSEIFDCLEFDGLGRNGAIPAYSFPFNSRYSDLSWIIEQQLFLSRKFPYLQNEQN